MVNRFESVLERLDVVKHDGEQYEIRCPAHEDRSPSMVAKLSDDGKKLLLHCRAGCSTAEICEAAHIELKELFADDENHPSSPVKYTVAQSYPYHDADGKEVYQVVRMKPKSFRQRHMVDGSWVWSMKGVRRVLFNLPSILEKQDWPVVVLEGEKDCLRLIATGLSVVPTTNAGGAGKWEREFSVALAGRRVVVVPDHDKAGDKHAVDVAGSLLVYGAASIRMVQLPGVPEGGDLSDYLDKNTAADLVKVIKATPEWRRV